MDPGVSVDVEQFTLVFLSLVLSFYIYLEDK